MMSIDQVSRFGIVDNNKGIEIAQKFYEKLGFTCCFKTQHHNCQVCFLSLGSAVIEVYDEDSANAVSGAIDHIALDVSDIDACYTAVQTNGFKILTEGIQFLPFGKHGIRYFIILGVNGEKIELSQRLS